MDGLLLRHAHGRSASLVPISSNRSLLPFSHPEALTPNGRARGIVDYPKLLLQGTPLVAYYAVGRIRFNGALRRTGAWSLQYEGRLGMLDLTMKRRQRVAGNTK